MSIGSKFVNLAKTASNPEQNEASSASQPQHQFALLQNGTPTRVSELLENGLAGIQPEQRTTTITSRQTMSTSSGGQVFQPKPPTEQNVRQEVVANPQNTPTARQRANTSQINSNGTRSGQQTVWKQTSSGVTLNPLFSQKNNSPKKSSSFQKNPLFGTEIPPQQHSPQMSYAQWLESEQKKLNGQINKLYEQSIDANAKIPNLEASKTELNAQQKALAQKASGCINGAKQRFDSLLHGIKVLGGNMSGSSAKITNLVTGSVNERIKNVMAARNSEQLTRASDDPIPPNEDQKKEIKDLLATLKEHEKNLTGLEGSLESLQKDLGALENLLSLQKSNSLLANSLGLQEPDSGNQEIEIEHLKRNLEEQFAKPTTEEISGKKQLSYPTFGFLKEWLSLQSVVLLELNEEKQKVSFADPNGVAALNRNANDEWMRMTGANRANGQ